MAGSWRISSVFVPQLPTRVSIGRVVMQPIVPFVQMRVGKKVVIGCASTHQFAIVVIDTIEFTSNLSLIIVFRLQQGLCEKTGQTSGVAVSILSANETSFDSNGKDDGDTYDCICLAACVMVGVVHVEERCQSIVLDLQSVFLCVAKETFERKKLLLESEADASKKKHRHQECCVLT
jgi:hypothetical protein